VRPSRRSAGAPSTASPPPPTPAAAPRAAAFGRQTESGEDSQKITALEQAGRLRRVAFTERAQMNAAVQPVMAAYAREIDAEGIHNRIASMTS
jgi:hypothetical protein